MTFTDYNKQAAKDITKELTCFFTNFQNEVKDNYPKIASLTQAFTDNVFGGKMIRGTLVYLGYDIAGAPKNPDIIKPATAVEIIHAGLLVQDDVMDQSIMRRGKPSLHMELGGNHYGISQTISLGDMGLFLGAELLAQADFDPQIKNKALLIEAKTITKTALGQMLDLYLPTAKEKIEEQDVMDVAATKSGYYSVTSPLLLGATFGNGDQELMNKLGEFGNNLGIAFQIQDDILGMFGDEEALGKSVTSDIAEGKQTILYLYALQEANSEQKTLLKTYYGKTDIAEGEAAQIRIIFKQTGALTYANKQAHEYANKAQAVIPQITKNKEHQQLLTQLAEALVKRQK